VVASSARQPVDDADAGTARTATLRRMSIVMPAAEVYGLANALRGAAGAAEDIGARLRDTGDVGGGVQAAVETFLESHRAAGRALVGELAWLGDTVAAVADSWLQLDGTLMPSHGRARAE
jgi:hypothetical protein